jgi:hypothetical protein
VPILQTLREGWQLTPKATARRSAAGTWRPAWPTAEQTRLLASRPRSALQLLHQAVLTTPAQQCGSLMLCEWTIIEYSIYSTVLSTAMAVPHCSSVSNQLAFALISQYATASHVVAVSLPCCSTHLPPPHPTATQFLHNQLLPAV